MLNERVRDVVDDASGGHDRTRHAIGGVCAEVRKVEMERRAADAVSSVGSVGSVVKRRSLTSTLLSDEIGGPCRKVVPCAYRSGCNN